MKKAFLIIFIAGIAFGAEDDEHAKLRTENKILSGLLQRCGEELNATKGIAQEPKSAQTEEIKVGEKIKIDEVLEFEILNSLFAKKVIPPKPKSFYNYYSVKGDDLTLLDITFNFKNLQGDDIDLTKVLKTTLIYDNKFKYKFDLDKEEADGSNFERNFFTLKIKPLVKNKIHLITEIPLEIETSDKPLFAIIQIKNTSYIYRIR